MRLSSIGIFSLKNINNLCIKQTGNREILLFYFVELTENIYNCNLSKYTANFTTTKSQN